MSNIAGPPTERAMTPRNLPTERPANSVVLALVLALLDLEQRDARGKVRPPMDRRRIA